MNIELIWAQDETGGIGKNGKLPWHISEDLQNFKKITLGSPIVMGRKTWDSLPFKPLPKRRNIVLSSRAIKGVEVYNSIADCYNQLEQDSVEKIFIIGGRSIYELFYFKASVLHLTIVSKNVKGIDTFFPITLDSIKKNFKIIKRFKLSESLLFI
tara:strand:- start:10 stop:474 length:465 start_codon:yes stop_codon:yes gene_type:complete